MSTSIEWTDATWNVTTGCTRVSAGCDNCYAYRMTKRLAGMGQTKYQGLCGKGHFNGVLKCHEDALEIPLHWRKPRRVFVNSMSDLFHAGVPQRFLHRVFAAMMLCPQYTFQILTKRPDRMAAYINGDDLSDGTMGRRVQWRNEAWLKPLNRELRYADIPWPLPNVMLGTSVEDQEQADKRIPYLLRCPAAVRFLSCEPLLGAVALDDEIGLIDQDAEDRYAMISGGDVVIHRQSSPFTQIDWVIIGCESKGAYTGRFADGYPAAARSIIDQCREAGVPAFHKQMPLNSRVSHDMSKWPEPFRVREWPAVATAEVV